MSVVQSFLQQEPTTRAYAIVGIALATFLVQQIYSSYALRAKMPPGPKGYPIIGNILDMGPKMWQVFEKWQDTHGPVIYMSLAGRSMVVLNTHKACFDLLEKRASIYSDRPRLIVAGEYMSGDLILGFLRQGDVWKRIRKASHEALSPQSTRSYRPFQVIESYLLAESFLDQPKLWNEHLRRSTTSFLMSVVYGTKSVTDSEDQGIKRLEEFLTRSLKAASGEYWVEFFHFLDKFPPWLAKWKTWALEHFKKDTAMFKTFYDGVLDRRAAGDDRPCVVSNLVDNADKKNLSELERIWVAGTMYAAGSDLSSATMWWLMAGLISFPNTIKAAHEELDRVIGRDRMPTFDDYDNLPYFRAMVKEILRWRPVAPLGVPHYTTADDWYEGKFIPKGTMVLSNIWAMNHSKEVYGPDAEDFNPARYLDKNGELLPDLVPGTHEEGHVTYGFGRRVCVGRHVANTNLFIQFASLLWAVNIEAPVDPKTGQKILPNLYDGPEDLTMRPLPFDIKISPRFPEVSELIKESVRNNHYNQVDLERYQ